jgi:hypothetical protein
MRLAEPVDAGTFEATRAAVSRPVRTIRIGRFGGVLSLQFAHFAKIANRR